MKIFLSLLLILFLALSSCSSVKKRDEAHKSQGEDSFVTSDDDDDLGEDLDMEEDVNEEVEVAEVDEVSDDMDGFDLGENRVVASYEQGSGDLIKYVVEKDDTLMLISFKVYGDYTRWREIKELNPSLGSKGLISGATLSLNKPKEQFVWEPQGTPYIIQSGDTLGTISKDKYGTSSKWKVLYENNRPLIKDPNLIFAGFTLYYKSSENEFAFNNIN